MLSKEAEQLILSGKAYSGMRVSGHIDLSNDKAHELPDDLTVDLLSLTGCRRLSTLPRGLTARRLILDGCTGLRSLPDDLECHELQWQNFHLPRWFDNVVIKWKLDLGNSPHLEELPTGLKVGALRVTDCTSLESLPEEIDTYFLDMRGCSDFERWPNTGSVRFGRLNVRECTRLTHLPDWLTQVGQLNLSGCRWITKLPIGLKITSWVDIGGTGIDTLSDSIEDRCLRWRGVPVDRRTVFEREKITAQDILTETNVERRRVLLELMGYEAFFQAAQATLLDKDTDRGGERRLLRVPMKLDEDLVCISVICPSTARQYIIRVPPKMTTCKMAAAWIAGFDREEDYAPLSET